MKQLTENYKIENAFVIFISGQRRFAGIRKKILDVVFFLIDSNTITVYF